MRNRQRASTPLESTTNSNRRLVMNYVGFDWASRAHDVTVLDEAGGWLTGGRSRTRRRGG